MVIIGFSSYPTESVKEFAKRFIEQSTPLPSYMTMKGPYVSSELGVGIKSIVIFEFDQSRIADAVHDVSARYAKYYGVPGFTYSQHAWLEAAEALKMIGLA
jgi:hypothetical protein